jgi:hypothetical protein
MAGEKRGIALEAILALSLDEIIKPSGNLCCYWNVKPRGMSIDPDLTIGTNPDTPDALCLVSFPEAYLNSGFKFWRNVAETWEAKVLLPSPPKVIAIQFGEGMKQDLVAVSRYVFDSLLLVSTSNGFSNLLKLVEGNANDLPPGRDEKKRHLKLLLLRNKQARLEFLYLKRQLATALRSSNPISASIWKKTAGYYQSRAGNVRLAKLTNFRVAFAKLALVTDLRPLLKAVRSRKALKEASTLAFLGFATKTLAGYRISDPDIEALINQCDERVITDIAAKLAGDKRLQIVLEPLRNISAVQTVIHALVRNWSKLRNPERLFTEMFKCHENPGGYAKACGATSNGYIRPGIVAEAIFEGMREIAGKNQAFGNKALIVGLAAQDKQKGQKGALMQCADRLGITHTKWRSSTTVSYGFRDWLFGADRTNFTLSKFELLRIAFVLANNMPDRESRATAELSDAILRRWAHNQFTNRFASYREFRPLDLLVEAALDTNKIQWRKILYFPTVWREVALANGEKLNSRSATSTIYQVRRTLVKTQSVTEFGASHKKKELCARAVGLRATCSNGTLGLRKVKLILMADGCFTNRDLAMLTKAGWDEIFYPDEMDKLAKAIV